MPGLKLEGITVVHNGNSGIEIRCKLTEKYNLVEYSLSDKPQTVLISPWMQFEPPKMNEERLAIAREIARRAVDYDNLLKQNVEQYYNLEQFRESSDLARQSLFKTIEMWREERQKYGLSENFSEIKDWPREMMSDFGNEEERKESRKRVYASDMLGVLGKVHESLLKQDLSGIKEIQKLVEDTITKVNGQDNETSN